MALFRWRLHGDGRSIAASEIVAPDERLSWPNTIGLGMQHVVAMFGATFLVPLITGFPPSTTLLFSGIGTCLFLIITANKVPSYLGSSFAFLAPIGAASSPGGALGGVIVVGALLAIVGGIVHLAGTRWIDLVMPPVVSGAIVALIGFNLAPTAKDNFVKQPLLAAITLFAVIICSVLFKGLLGRLSIVLGVLVGYIASVIAGAVNFAPVGQAAWIGLPEFTTPRLELAVIPIFLPVVVVLIAENVGHVKGVAQLTKRDLDPLTGRALFADGIATVISGIGGGSPTTTYGENIGVMAATKVYSTAAYWVAGIFAILLGLSPKIGAVINTVPPGVIGGVTTVLYGLIGIIGVRIWLDNKVDFSKPANQITAATALIMGIADFTLKAGGLTFAGIALGSIAAIGIYHVMTGISRIRGTDVPAAEEPAPPTTR